MLNFNGLAATQMPLRGHFNRASRKHFELSLSELKSEHIDDAIRRELASEEGARRPEWRAILEIAASSAFATWREDQEGSPRRCGLTVRSMGSIFAEKALYGSRAATTNPPKLGGALGSGFRGMRTASCDFIFGTVRSSTVQGRSWHKRPPRSPYGISGFRRALVLMARSHGRLVHLVGG